jgi:osmotically-inducible protein OsmY
VCEFNRKWEKTMKKWSLMCLAATLMGFGIVGCTSEAQSKYDAAGDAAAKAGDKIGEGVKADSEAAGAAVKEAGAEVKQTGDNALMTGKVRNAIETANDVKIEDLNVDTMDKKIILKGNTTDEKSRNTAGQIAKTQAGNDYTVDNQITVNAKPVGGGQ